MRNKLNIKRWRPKKPAPSNTPAPTAATVEQPSTSLPVYDPNDPDQGWLWRIHLRRVQRYGPAAALFSGIKPDKRG